MIWKKQLWGVEFKGSINDDDPMLLGRLWHEYASPGFRDEPTRALLFKTREAAREWCRRQLDKNKDRTDCCALWRFRPVRVIETVRKA
jgi:hypothetical protein